MDIYSTGALNRVVASLKRPQTLFLNSFYSQVETSTTEEIFFDVELDGEKRRLAPFVHPMAEGKVVESAGYITRSFKPAYTKDKRAHDSSRPFKRAAGETIGTGQTLTPLQRRQLALRRDLRDQVDMITARKEHMAIQAIRDGKIDVDMLMPEGDTKQVVIDFGRNQDLQINLADGAKWGQDGVRPLNDIEDWSLETLERTGSSTRNIVMDPSAWRVLRDSSDLAKRLDLRRVISGQIDLSQAPEHVSYKGSDGSFDYWVYADWYYDSAAEQNRPVLDRGRVMGIGDIQGVQHHGAIKDEDAGFQALEYYSKTWTKKDPSVRILLMQSAPLTVPYRINASWSARVL